MDTMEEEAYFYKAIADIEELIEKYGAEFVMSKLRYPIYMKLFRYFEGL